MWQTQSFPSGTCIVKNDDPTKPHLDVYGPYPLGEKDKDGEYPESIKKRYEMCDELATYLNGGNRPKWLDKMEVKNIGLQGYKIEGKFNDQIYAIGPMQDIDGTLNWQEAKVELPLPQGQ